MCVVVYIIYDGFICVCRFAVRAVMGLEFSQYLENYLWPHFTAERVCVWAVYVECGCGVGKVLYILELK